MSQADYYINLLVFCLNLAGLAVSVGLGAALVWYWWNFVRYFR